MFATIVQGIKYHDGPALFEIIGVWDVPHTTDLAAYAAERGFTEPDNDLTYGPESDRSDPRITYEQRYFQREGHIIGFGITRSPYAPVRAY